MKKNEFTNVLKNFKKSFVSFMILNILLCQFLYAGIGSSGCSQPLPERELLQNLQTKGIGKGGWEFDKNELEGLTALIRKEEIRLDEMLKQITDCESKGFCSYYAEEVAMYFRDGKSIFSEEKKFNRMMKRFESNLKEFKSSTRHIDGIYEGLAKSKAVRYEENLEFVEDITQKFRSGEYKQALVMIQSDKSGHVLNAIPLKIGDDIHPFLFDSQTQRTELIGKDFVGTKLFDRYLIDKKAYRVFSFPPNKTSFSRGYIFANYLMEHASSINEELLKVSKVVYLE